MQQKLLLLIFLISNLFSFSQDHDEMTHFDFRFEDEVVKVLQNGKSQTITLPFPNGESIIFSIQPNSILHPSLKAKFPQIHTYSGKSTQGQYTLCIDIGDHGIHAMITGESKKVFIVPLQNGFYQSRYTTKNEDIAFEDEIDNSQIKPNQKRSLTSTYTLPTGDKLRTYRLAVATTGEYSKYHGGTKSSTLSAIATTINRVNEIYNAELGIALEIVANNDEIIFLNPNTDPFTNSDASKLLKENQTTITAIIGKENYDIGHVFGTAAGGYATLQSVCEDNYKSQGVTGMPTPSGEYFDIEYVAHEMGHQFGANHTFNGSVGACSGNITNNAYEPGSGNTIMGYAGICGAHNLQDHTDPYFHVSSLHEIHEFVSTYATCGTITNTDNQQPLVSINHIDGLYIPTNTPFELSAEGADLNNDTLYYNFEEFDLGAAGHPNSPSVSAPLFRSFSPTTTPKRTFPQMSDILSNSQTIGEILPQITRDINIKAIVRDNHGGVNSDQITIKVQKTVNSFSISSQSTDNTSYNALDTIDIFWTTANTELAPFLAEKLNLYISYDNGDNFDLVMENIINDGHQKLKLPLKTSTQCYFKIKPTNNIFFSINQQSFVITPPKDPGFETTLSTDTIYSCIGSVVNFSGSINSYGGFTDTVHLSTSPKFETIVNFNNNKLTGTETTIITITTSEVGQLSIPVIFSYNNVNDTIYIETITNNATANTFVRTSIPQSGNINIDSKYEWDAQNTFEEYTLEISETNDFLTSFSYKTNQKKVTLDQNIFENRPYFYRITSKNICTNTIVYSDTAYFFNKNQTSCFTFESDKANKTIPILNQPTTISVSKSIQIPLAFVISDLKIQNIQGDHTYVSDLTFSLESNNKSVTLLSKKCTSSQNFNFSIETNGSLINCPINTEKIYSSENSLLPFIGLNSNSEFILKIEDSYAIEDGGFFTGFDLTLCTKDNFNHNVLNANQNKINILDTNNYTFKNSSLRCENCLTSGLNTKYIIVNTPKNGILSLLQNGTNIPLNKNNIFTQSDIDELKINYKKTKVDVYADTFSFIIYDETGNMSDIIDYSILSNTVSISNEVISSEIKIYPNPTSGTFSLDINEISLLQIQDMNGKLIFQKEIIPLETIDISSLTNGTYSVTITTKDKIYRKLIVLSKN